MSPGDRLRARRRKRARAVLATSILLFAMAAWVLAVWWFLVGWWRPDGCLDQGLSFDYRGWVCDLDAGPVRPAGILLTSHFLGLVAAVATTWAALLIRQNLRSKD